MKTLFPLRIFDFNKEEENIFDKYFAEENGEFYFEGMWFRSQRIENAQKSGYVDETTKRQRYIHFYNTYVNQNHALTLKYAYLVVCNTLPKEECNEYVTRVFDALHCANFAQVNATTWEKDGLQIIVNQYKEHPKHMEYNIMFPSNYTSVDVIAVTKDYDYMPLYNRMWEHSTKLYRVPQQKGHPTYITDISEIEQFLPAQIEFGCGPSIEADIDPLYVMHETYKVQSHQTGRFYFGKQDDLIQNIILSPTASYLKFSQTPKKCIQAEHTEAYKIFNQLYKKGLFVGTVFNNNFDRLVKRFDIPEQILRTYQKSIYIQKLNFDEKAKSLICFGTHADRRQVQKQAREKGLKVIFVDPEGFFNKTFEPYPIEAPQDEDYILKLPFSQAMQLFKDKFLK